MNPALDTTPTKKSKISAWKDGWHLARASWSTLKLDKELLWLPIYSFLVSMVVTGLVALLYWKIGIFQANPHTNNPLFYLGLFVELASTLAVAYFFTGAFVSSILHRFNGHKPSVAYGLAQARSKWLSLLEFSLVSALLMTIFQIIQNDRFPLASKILAWVADIAWQAMTIFAVPVIMASEKPIGPFEVARESSNILKRVWKQDVAIGLSMGLIFLPALLLLVFLGIITGILVVAVSPLTLFVTIPLWVAAATAWAVLYGGLTTVFHAALYHFATTGQSPAKFDEQLLRAAFRPKKKWFV